MRTPKNSEFAGDVGSNAPPKEPPLAALIPESTAYGRFFDDLPKSLVRSYSSYGSKIRAGVCAESSMVDMFASL